MINDAPLAIFNFPYPTILLYPEASNAPWEVKLFFNLRMCLNTYESSNYSIKHSEFNCSYPCSLTYCVIAH